MAEMDSDIEQDLQKMATFLKDKASREKLMEFMEKGYLSVEDESAQRRIAKERHEHESELQGALPWHKPGHIGGLIHQYLNMIAVEQAFSGALQHTKSSLTKTVQQRVDEINTLLRGVGGFNRQLKPSFSRSAVIYLEQEDPIRPHRERILFTINLGEFELKHHLADTQRRSGNTETGDGRSPVRVAWDFCFNALSEIVSNTGLKPTYVKNDKNSFSMVMRQDIVDDPEVVADEFFSFELEYNTKEKLDKYAEDYKAKDDVLKGHVHELEEKLESWWTKLSPKRVARVHAELDQVRSQYRYFVGTTPDPREMDPGLQFTIRVRTLKNYGFTKDKMQVIMTKYILALSSIARDKSMDEQLRTDYGRPGGGTGVEEAKGGEPKL